MKRTLGFVILAVGISTCVSAATLTYPALGNIDLSEGTIEAWIILKFDPTPDTVEGTRLPFTFLTIKSDPDNYLWLLWRIRRSHTGPYATSKSNGNKFTPNWGLVEGWAEGEKHHIAFCWEQGRNWWIIDGKKMGEVKQGLRHNIPINERLKIVLGGREDGKLIIDDLRISLVARNETEVGFHAPGSLNVDPVTLLLDTFDDAFECDGIMQTKPEVMMPSTQQTGGVPDKRCEFVPGISGTGLKL